MPSNAEIFFLLLLHFTFNSIKFLSLFFWTFVAVVCSHFFCVFTEYFYSSGISLFSVYECRFELNYMYAYVRMCVLFWMSNALLHFSCLFVNHKRKSAILFVSARRQKENRKTLVIFHWNQKIPQRSCLLWSSDTRITMDKCFLQYCVHV